MQTTSRAGSCLKKTSYFPVFYVGFGESRQQTVAPTRASLPEILRPDFLDCTLALRALQIQLSYRKDGP